MFWNISSIIPLSAFAAYSLLLSIVIWRNPDTKPARIFILYLASMVIWSLGSFLMHLDPPLGTPLFWNRFMVVGAFAMPIIFYSFVRSFLEIRKQKIWLYLGAVLYVSLFTANAMGHFAKEAYVSEGVFYYEYELGIAVYFAGVSWFFFVGLAAFNLIQSYRKVKDSFYRNRLKYLLLGILIMAAGIVTNLTKLGKYPLDISLNVINALLLTYVILKYKLLDINIIIRKGFVYFTLTAIIASVYLFTIFILERLLRGVVSISLIAVLMAIGIALIFQPLRDFLQRWIDRLFFREKFDYYQILREFTQKMVTILDLDNLANSTVNTIGKTMQTDKVAILLTNKKEFNLKGSLGLDKSFASSFKLERDNPLLAYMAKKREILARGNIDIIPQLKGLWESKIRELEMLEAELFIPLITKDNLIGIIILGKKLSEDSYSEEEYALLSTVAQEASVAFENARLYGEIEEAKIKLQNWGEELERKVKEKTEELEHSQALVLQSEKLAGLGQLAAGVAHEIRNPLGIIATSMYYLNEILPEKRKEVKKHFHIVESEIDRCQTIINNLLEFSRTSNIEVEPVDINTLLNMTLSLVEKELFGHDIRLIKKMESVPKIKANLDEIKQVFLNLILNATQAMPKGGELRIITSGHNDKVRIKITDTGMGISKENLDKIFNPFFTTKEPGEGTGLGLAFVHTIIERYGGTIRVESEKGKGTTFIIELSVL
ncbi:GAF domain-containing protein [Candidatus Aerophobetes bacterium]|uniref:histidine kinase n=1 Tax=Aerophobetes bacterium TaxID=2030807 RepID=A0A523RRE7_UNCAE|nr:MAG: GAF domain-containing protein [Candidatus Aerophobetes bacterium]